MSVDLFIFAGEASADLHGAELLKALFQIDPQLKVCGVGGPHMRATGMECLVPMEKFQVMGFVDVFLDLPRLVYLFYKLKRVLLKKEPKVALFIDYPGFNLRMESALRKKGFKGKICHYICPSVWAWGKGRIQKIAKNCDLLLTILPFEKTYFSSTPVAVKYVGHPLIAKIKNYHYKEDFLSKEAKEHCLLALFPGSRKKEILRNLALQLKIAQKLHAKHADLKIGISVSQTAFLPLIKKMVRDAGFWEENVKLVPAKYTYELMHAADIAIAKSGTVTLELALHGVPTVVIYGISALDLFIARDLLRIRLPYYCIVNIIYNDEVFPELIGPHLTEKSLFEEASLLLESSKAQNNCRSKCLEIRALLQEKDASQEAAKAVHSLLLENR